MPMGGSVGKPACCPSPSVNSTLPLEHASYVREGPIQDSTYAGVRATMCTWSPVSRYCGSSQVSTATCRTFR